MKDRELIELEGFPPLSLSVRHFSLMNSLLTVFNSTEPGDPENTIAQFFLEHFESLDQLNVYDVAEECYTSRSGIRRFCQSIGFDNFSALKACAWEWRTHQKFFIDYTNHSSFKAHLSNEIGRMIASVNEQISDEDLDSLAQLIHDAGKVILLASDFSSMAVREFQQSMLFMHKIPQILTDSFGSEKSLESMGPSDLIIVISASGNYARAAQNQLSRSAACRVLITTNRDHGLRDFFDAVLQLSPENHYGERTVYAKYGITYVFDLVYNHYFEKFGKR